MTELHTFVDLDGVVLDFDGHFKAHYGMLPEEIEHKHNGGVTELFRMVSLIPNFWTELPLMPGAMDLWAAVLPYNPIILSGCPQIGYDAAVAGKRLSVAKRLGPSVPVITCRSKDKPLHIISPGDRLIDDRGYILKKWRKAGGVGVLYRNAPQAIADFHALIATQLADAA